MFIASYTGTQVGPIIFIQGQSVYILTVYSYLHVEDNRTYLCTRVASYKQKERRLIGPE
jgi:hypothetical protein